MSKPKRGNWRVRECAASVQSMIDDYSEHKSGDPGSFTGAAGAIAEKRKSLKINKNAA